MPDKMTLKQWMAFRDFTVEEFAKRVGCSTPSVSSWRNGKTAPNAKYIPKIEEVLQTDFKNIKDLYKA